MVKSISLNSKEKKILNYPKLKNNFFDFFKDFKEGQFRGQEEEEEDEEADLKSEHQRIGGNRSLIIFLFFNFKKIKKQNFFEKDK